MKCDQRKSHEPGLGETTRDIHDVRVQDGWSLRGESRRHHEIPSAFAVSLRRRELFICRFDRRIVERDLRGKCVIGHQHEKDRAHREAVTFSLFSSPHSVKLEGSDCFWHEDF